MTDPHRTPPYGLGRRVAPDPRDDAYPFALMLPMRLPLQRRRHWTIGHVLHQGRTNSCVGQAIEGYQMCTPVPTYNGPKAWEIYRWAVDNDEWTDNDGRDEGTSLRAGMRYLMHAGRLHSYLWARSIDEVVNWVLRKGPVIVGTEWREAMFTPDASGLVRPLGRSYGGHAYLLYGADLMTETLSFVNSWGTTWGLGGRFKMTISDFAMLLTQRGEAVVAVERRILPLR